jgi:hypothetical protein
MSKLLPWKITMNKFHKSLMTTTAIGLFIALPLSETKVKAQESAVIQCVKEYTKLNISPDAALAQCQKNSVGSCVKELMGKKYVAKSVSESSGRYLIDLGDSDTRWLEGKGWNDKGCSANTQGPYKRQSSKQRSYEWFRQGFCTQSQIELEQNYSLEEAKTLCELGLQPK